MERRRKVLFGAVLVALAVSVAGLLHGRLEAARPVYEQIESAVRDSDRDYKQLLHVHVDAEHTLVFYETLKEELSVVTLDKSATGFKLREYINKQPMYTDKDISWTGTQRPDDIYLLFGTVLNPLVTQVIVVSEGGQPARIAEQGGRKIWYYKADGHLQAPITLRAFDKDGNRLYEWGDPAYWEDAGN
ncbi:hypothetical protein [Cohnella sp. GCM10027633]|uniref:hypothetical protein n=1 Tax=unclassified Cohnella TaxID=2636738 RepID=UPI00364129FA